ncbi:MAG: hypothetical protein IAE78_16350 [Myxococcus sp.]|nr:hypothetical protein [Myxococcus sp.]
MRRFCSAAAFALLAACGTRSPCTPTSCAPGSTCEAARGVCVDAPTDAGRASDGGAGADAGIGPVDAGDASADAGPASGCGACAPAIPICDEASRRCVRCTARAGCFGDTPMCDLSFQGGLGKCETCVADGGGCSGATPVCDTLRSRCVGCLGHADCESGMCNLATEVCFPPGPFDAGAPAVDAGGAGCPGPRDGGVTSCVTECPQGFTCSGNECILNGRGADLQVTLRWDSTDDLDLHLDEPLAGGGTCEIWYGARTPACAAGALDLDSQAGCAMDLVLIENIVYPTDGGVPPSGLYTVRVDHYANCSPIQWVPFQVEVRKGSSTMGLCGVFTSTDPDWRNAGAAGSGRPIMTFTYP